MYAVDEAPHTAWVPEPADAEPFIEVDLEREFAVEALRIIWSEENLDIAAGRGPQPVKYRVDFFDGAIIVASIDGDFTVKYLRKNSRTAFLEPANANFKPIYFTQEQDVRFWGVVTGVVRKINYTSTRKLVSEPELAPQEIISNSNPGIRLNGTREKYKEKLGSKK
jgi:hypothetical protein